ncbi:MAG: sigma-70 family RNA polymerase sigma factor [Firmicutes bacterium]|nr:sigma-70 family RNA polymerase sigma factor [Bacillota bacterium]
MIYDNFFINTELPKPLSNEEMIEHFQKFHQGDLNSRKILINHNIRLVIAIIFKNFKNMSYSIEDLIGYGLIGLVKSIDTYDITKKYKFVTYASKCIYNEILQYIRKENKHLSNSVNIEDKFLEFEINKNEEIDFVKDYLENEKIMIIKDIIDELPDLEKELIYSYYGLNNNPLSQQEIAQKLNISQPHVSRKIKMIIKKIILKLHELGIIENNSNENHDLKKELIPLLETLVDELPDLEKQIMNLYYGLNNNHIFTQTEIAQQINMSQPSVFNKIKIAQKIIISKMQKQGVLINEQDLKRIRKKGL